MASEDEVKLEMIMDEDDAEGIKDVKVKFEDGRGSVSGEPSGDHPHPKRKGRNMYFDDGVRRIDFILAWEVPEKKDEQDEDEIKAKKARNVFEKNLEKEGLGLERDLRDEKVHYCKVHAPWEVLTRYAEILKIRMKMKETRVAEKIQKKYSKWEDTYDVNPVKAVSTTIWNTINKLKNTVRAPFELDRSVLPKIKKEPTLAYSREREYLFDIPEQKELFFNNAERSRIVDFILRRQAFEEVGEEKSSAYTFGVSKMLADGYYTGAYPLHEGHWKEGSVINRRKLLYDNWAYWKRFFKIQPLEHIRNYYGSKIALYFAWLGFYTQMLVVPSILGLIIFIYGVAYMDDSYPSKEICDTSKNFTMCPMCDFQCPYWFLHDTCNDSKYSRMFDNNGTVFFAIFMSMWGTLFLEFWKRKQAIIQHKWDLVDFVKEEEPPRPEYLAKLANYPRMKLNPVTGLKEPHLPFWRKRFPIFLMSYGIMLFTMCLAIAGVVGVIAYRVSTFAALQLLEKDEIDHNATVSVTTKTITQNASLITTITAACINLTIIIILNIIYGRIVLWLTDFETLRTQSEYDDSINIKLFSLQFVNYYSSIIYIAFFKGRLVGRPGAYNMAFGARQEECGSSGCLIELCIQLAIIMVGKQFIQNNLLEIVLPKSIKWLKRCYRRKILKETAEQKAAMPAWEKDYLLNPAENTSLYHEYLEMVLQYGFLTLFVAAFPLGPLCCMLNNITEIRSDAMKFITDMRRPVAERIPDIGIWYQILYAISRLAIVSNAFIIALTSDFIPRLVYVYYYSESGDLQGYTNFTLSYFRTSDFERDKEPHFNQDVDLCRYRDFRNPPWEPKAYEYSEAHWHVLAARFAFVVVFENFIVVLTSLIAWMIPDVPAKVKNQIRREAYISNEIVIQTESRKARGETPLRGMLDTLRALKPDKGDRNGSDIRHRGDTGDTGDKRDTRDTSEVVIERDPNDKSYV